MLNLKKTAVAVLAFGSSVAFAGTMGPVCTAGNVTIPCEKTAWDLGVQALYLQPSYSENGGYIGRLTSAANTVDYVAAKPKWSWGFKLEGSYHFNTGNDLNLNWYHLGNKTRSRSYAANFTPAFDLPNNRTATAYQVKPTWDAVNLELGQHVDFAEFKNVRLHGGVQYARIKTNRNFIGTTGTTVYNYLSASKYTGFGARVGADGAYGFGNGLGIYANTAVALLAGTSKLNTIYTDNALAPANLPAASYGSRQIVVPEAEAKLGANYTFAMAQGDLTLDAGWMWVNYFNAQQVALTASNPSESDFAVQGPFFGAKWVGSVA